MEVAEAWNITKGDTNLIIAVIDEEVDNNNSDLPGSRQVRLPGANVAAVYYDSTQIDSVYSTSQHGNSYAGIIAATHNNGIGI